MACSLLVSLPSCKDDFVAEDPANKADSEIEGDCLQFTIQLDKALSSRDDASSAFLSDEKYDSYIDTQDKFRVFFFTADGDFLFGATDRVVGKLSSAADYNYDYWYVRIPMTMIVDRDNQEYDIEKIKNYLKNNPFKIAVLANWPNAGEKVNPADWDDSEGTPDGSGNPSSTLKGNPQWNWSNSILNKDASPSDIRNINDLHHVYNDLYYASTSSNGGLSRYEVYKNFMANAKEGNESGYYMGEPTDWVKMRTITDADGWKADYNLSTEVAEFDSKTTANQWIRANWTPDVDRNQNKRIYRHYQHMWFLWNFHASYVTGDLAGNVTYKTVNNKQVVDKVNDKSAYNDNWGWNDDGPAKITNNRGDIWYQRNGDLLYKWMKASYSNKAPIGSITIDIGESNNDVFFKYTSKTGYPAYCVNVNNFYGIQLPAIGEGKKVDYTGMMSFQARTSGTLRVKWSSLDGTPSGVAVQVGLPKQSGNSGSEIYHADSNYSLTTPKNWTNPDDNLQYVDITVSEGSRPVYIFGTTGKPVIYSVEFIRGRYLYETDREGIAPSEHQGIPMYGVQDFKKIDDWQRGTTQNLPNNVYLIRALAKIEVYIKKEFGEPKHMLMRGINRAARCEPMDVHTPTDKLWGNEMTDDHSTNHPATYPATDFTGMCEWYRIFQYGVAYKNPSATHAEWLNWFYGSWKYNPEDQYPIKWKTSGGYRYNRDRGYFEAVGEQQGWPGISSGNWKIAPPHIFNPYNYRSDFVRFLKVGDTYVGQDHYYKYVLYVPEKNIDDPSVVGDLSSTPKIAHIEYRFVPEKKNTNDDIAQIADDEYSNTEYNLDDNDCFRIYFTNYGANTSGSNGPVNEELKERKWYRETYDEYEQDRERITKHWPIMRNHKYKLYVSGSSPENPEVHVQVTDWGHRKVVVEW